MINFVHNKVPHESNDFIQLTRVIAREERCSLCRKLFIKVLTAVRRGTGRRLSTSDDHAIFDGYQFLDVVALHVRIGFIPAAHFAAPSTAELIKINW